MLWFSNSRTRHVTDNVPLTETICGEWVVKHVESCRTLRPIEAITLWIDFGTTNVTERMITNGQTVRRSKFLRLY